MRNLADVHTKLFADGADKRQILRSCANPRILGFTTNPTLMCSAGIRDYETFAREVAEAAGGRPVSFEVFADDFPCMERQARKIASWGGNVFVKIPITNTEGRSSLEVISLLAHSGVQVNVTAILTLEQVRRSAAALAGGAPSFISVFAGRIADTGRDPSPVMAAAAEIVSAYPNIELIWASPRELFNIFQANDAGCHIITLPDSILAKLDLVGKNLEEYSLETVRMFFNDAAKAGYSL